MLTARLETIWKGCSEEERRKAKAWADVVLGNLIHYPIRRGKHYDDDVEFLAAEFLAYREEIKHKPEGV